MCKDIPPIEQAIQFHGHICPGLLMGVRAAEFALKHLDIERDADEELLAVVEGSSCGVDAIQSILGCTLGKGNLIVKDYGKAVYIITKRDNKTALRIAQKFNTKSNPYFGRYRELCNKNELSSEENTEKENLLGLVFESIMTTPFEELFDWKEISFAIPDKAEIRQTLQCSICLEGVMDKRAHIINDEVLCSTCHEDKGLVV